jgi:hypothetical protein
MARVALLVGTGQYGEHFQALDAIPRNLKAMEEVLKHPEMGGFDEVRQLCDPTHTDMAVEIQKWLVERHRDDLLLLYLAGHGVKNAQRQLYFAASNTQKVRNELLDATALEARNVNTWLRNSRAKRQIIILDCCFSGAFGDLIAQDDGSVDLEAELGYEGRIVLTSSSSTQYSFQKDDGDLSIYTQYLIEGIRTGAADRDQDGVISTDELHEYASEKVQAEAPAMTPKIIVAKDRGYKLRVANTPLSDPTVKYWKEVEKVVDKDQGEITSLIAKRILKQWRLRLDISDEQAAEIERKVLEPYRQYLRKIQEYQETLEEALEQNNPLTEQDRKLLKDFQHLLGLKDEDVAEFQDIIAQAIEVEELQSKQQQTNLLDKIDIRSKKGVNYEPLRDLLKAGKWEEADRETNRVMLQVAGREEQGYLLPDDLKEFPCEDLLTIDRLWVEASHGHFGFSVQKKIWQECGSPMSAGKDWDRFCDKVGWKQGENYVQYSDLKKNPSLSLTGELPSGLMFCEFGEFVWQGWYEGEVSLFSRSDL